MFGQNCKTQNGTDHLQALPDRIWKDYFGEIARKAGLGAAMAGAGLGVSGFGVWQSLGTPTNCLLPLLA